MSWETTGTVTVTNNSATVTGSGTLFTVKSRVGDAFIGPDGALYEIVNIVSNTVLSISPTYKGVTGSAKAYKIAPVRGYQKLSADRLYTIVNTIGDAVEVVTDLPTWLKAKQPTPVSAGGTGAETQLAARQNLGLKGAAVLDIGTAAGTVAAGDDARLTDAREWIADTIPQAEAEAGTATTRRAFTSQRLRQGITAWFTGISGAIGRTILGRSTAAEVRGDLELGYAATAPTVGNGAEVMRAGAYGLGTPIGLDSRDIDTVNTAGFYICDVCTGTPSGYDSGMLISHGAGPVVRMQIFNPYGTDKLFFRSFLSGWNSWIELHNPGNILQTTGTSTGYPMSQKATTDALNLKANSNSLGTAATANLTTSISDGTVGRVLKVGDGGWMGQGDFWYAPLGYPVNASDATNQTKVIRSNSSDNGIHAASSGIHFSSHDTWGRLRVSPWGANAWIQGGQAASGSGWTAELYHTGNILGTVGQSAGVPTGAIIERGSNANGEYTRFADGTQICIKRASRETSVGPGLPYIVSIDEMAAAFSNIPTYNFSDVVLYTGTARERQLYGSIQTYMVGSIVVINTGFSPSSVYPSFTGLGAETANALEYVVTAIGRWY